LTKQARKTGMTVEEFREKYNGAPYEVEELARIAKDVHGDVGKRAHTLLTALKEFDAALAAIDFEVG
jgi:hypothetical protein